MSVDQIIFRYNPEKDIIPGGPMVTWAEHDLAKEILSMREQFRQITNSVAALEKKSDSRGDWSEISTPSLGAAPDLAQQVQDLTKRLEAAERDILFISTNLQSLVDVTANLASQLSQLGGLVAKM